MVQRVAVTGASGFVGSATVSRLRQDGQIVRAILRSGHSPMAEANENVVADVANAASLSEAFLDCDAVIHLVAIIKEKGSSTFEGVIAEGTENVVKACRSRGVARLVYVSALGTGEKARGKYYAAKRRAEEAVIGSGIPYVILRPSLIIGEGDAFLDQFAGKSVPLPANGSTRFQPVCVQDVACMLSMAASSPAEGTYEVGGPAVLSLRQMVETAERKHGRRGWHPGVPLGLVKFVARLVFDPLLRAGKEMPTGSDALAMLDRPNVCSPGELERTLEVLPVSLARFEDCV